jgi:hypothetical protein
MKTENFKLKIRAILPILGLIFFLNGERPVSAQTLPNFSTRRAQVTISASIGEPVLRLWGYGPSNSRVELGGNGVADFTYARVDGYFEFSRTYLPSPANLLYPELCLTGIDLVNRTTPPTCIPPLLANGFSYDIGPVILPPTISLDTGTTAPATQTGASGITIPNSEVIIVLAEGSDNESPINFSIVKPILAYYIPDYTVKSDSRGYFSFNMPNAIPDNWRVFAITTYSQGATSPKSNTLTLKVISPTTFALESIWKLILSLLTLPVLIILEILIILIITATLFLTKRGRMKVAPSISKQVNIYH